MDPIKALADRAMRIFANLAAEAAPSSDFALGRRALGEDRFYEVALEALRGGLKDLLLAGEEVLPELDAAGEAAASERLLGVAQGAIRAVAEHSPEWPGMSPETYCTNQGTPEEEACAFWAAELGES